MITDVLKLTKFKSSYNLITLEVCFSSHGNEISVFFVKNLLKKCKKANRFLSVGTPYMCNSTQIRPS